MEKALQKILNILKKFNFNLKGFLKFYVCFWVCFLFFYEILNLHEIFFETTTIHLTNKYPIGKLSIYRYKNTEVFYYGPHLTYQLKFEIQNFLHNFQKIDFKNQSFFLYKYNIIDGYFLNFKDSRWLSFNHPNISNNFLKTDNFHINIPCSTNYSTYPYTSFLENNFKNLNEKKQFISTKFFMYYQKWTVPVNYNFENYNNNYNIYNDNIIKHFKFLKKQTV